MTGRNWTTEGQYAWLSEKLVDYNKIEGDYSAFWNPLFESWFKEYPQRLHTFPDIPLETQLTSEQSVVLAKDIVNRKDRLRTWFRWRSNASKSNRSLKTKEAKILSSILQPKTRRKSPAEVYFDLHYEDRVKPLLELSDTDKAKPGANLVKGRQLAKELFANEDADIKAAVKTFHASQKKKSGIAVEETCAKTIQNNIDGLAVGLDRIFEHLSRLTRWKFSVVMGGPDPSKGWEISTAAYHYGTTPMGSNYANIYPQFDRDILDSFAGFLELIFPPGSRIPGGEGSSNAFEDNLDGEDKQRASVEECIMGTRDAGPSRSSDDNRTLYTFPQTAFDASLDNVSQLGDSNQPASFNASPGIPPQDAHINASNTSHTTSDASLTPNFSSNSSLASIGDALLAPSNSLFASGDALLAGTSSGSSPLDAVLPPALTSSHTGGATGFPNTQHTHQNLGLFPGAILPGWNDASTPGSFTSSLFDHDISTWNHNQPGFTAPMPDLLPVDFWNNGNGYLPGSLDASMMMMMNNPAPPFPDLGVDGGVNSAVMATQSTTVPASAFAPTSAPASTATALVPAAPLHEPTAPSAVDFDQLRSLYIRAGLPVPAAFSQVPTTSSESTTPRQETAQVATAPSLLPIPQHDVLQPHDPSVARPPVAPLATSVVPNSPDDPPPVIAPRTSGRARVPNTRNEVANSIGKENIPPAKGKKRAGPAAESGSKKKKKGGN
ncbi:hypothetical protein BJ138DRAFT_1116494 [Hygrophoropsis aurantiaca]|uniref:Uncharacterized protein n=1 Tax=Hygrophoropsis aurantiaca TaxID=72124 RepID=A0ACB8A3D1_9AGAM|nr:hypothetical protein BJ138DRAFT_1116494 [Hygrophoropsis aurantiaca]